MGLKSFLQQQGFIENDAESKAKEKNTGEHQPAPVNVPPTYFPVDTVPSTNAKTAASGEPSFVTPVQQATGGASAEVDPSFIKFFEDELVKANLPGPDYFEFRQLLVKTQQKMAAKGVVAPDVVLQAVMTSFEAQDVAATKLVDAAKHYKEVLSQKKEDFLKGAGTEKNNQLQKRQSALQAHDDNIRKLQQQMEQLEQQRRQLEDVMNKEKTQMDVDKSLGKEGIEKIEKAERLINQAHAFMQASIDTDIKRLQSV